MSTLHFTLWSSKVRRATTLAVALVVLTAVAVFAGCDWADDPPLIATDGAIVAHGATYVFCDGGPCNSPTQAAWAPLPVWSSAIAPQNSNGYYKGTASVTTNLAPNGASVCTVHATVTDNYGALVASADGNCGSQLTFKIAVRK